MEGKPLLDILIAKGNSIPDERPENSGDYTEMLDTATDEIFLALEAKDKVRFRDALQAFLEVHAGMPMDVASPVEEDDMGY